MEEDTKKIGVNVTKSDIDSRDLKKMPIKFANNPKILNMCQPSNAVKFSVVSHQSTSVANPLMKPSSPTAKNMAVTSSLLKKLPGNISVSTQKVVVSQEQQQQILAPTFSTSSHTLIPNKPVVVQAINPTTSGNSSVVTVSTSRKIVLNTTDSRFLKLMNAPPEKTSIPENKRVIVQRVEQIQPPHGQNIIAKSVNPPISPIKQSKMIVVSGNATASNTAATQSLKKDDSFIVNEMPPEMRKAIIVSSNNPTGDLTKVIKIPMHSSGKITHDPTLKGKIDPGKIAPVTITKKFLPVKASPVKGKLPTLQGLSKVPNADVKVPEDKLTLVRRITADPPKVILPNPPKVVGLIDKRGITFTPKPILPKPDFPTDFFGDEKKSSYEKICEKLVVLEKNESQTSTNKSESEVKDSQKEQESTKEPEKLKKEDLGDKIYIQIKDGKLSHPHGPIQMLDRDLTNIKEKSPERTSAVPSSTKSPRMKARSKSTMVDPSFLIAPPRMRSPSLSSILPEFTKQSKQLMKQLEMAKEAQRRSQTPSLGDTSDENLLNNLLCDENMDTVSGSNESSPGKEDLNAENGVRDENKENDYNGNESKNDDNETKDASNEESDVDISGFPDPDESQLTPPASPTPAGRKRRRISETDSESGILNVLKVPVHKLFKVESGRINDDIHMSDPFRYIKWKDGIGSLEDSTIHFKVNQLGVYELMSNEEYYRLIKHKPDKDLTDPIKSRENIQRKVSRDVLYKCQVCSGVGTAKEFRNPTICSWSCEEIISKRIKNEIDDDSNSTSPMTDLDETSQQDSPVSLPTLPHHKTKDAPSELFRNAFPDMKNNFQIGMKLEAIDPYNQSLFCVCTIEDKRGFRIKLRFDSYPSDYNFWVNADSNNIFPPGWCAATDRNIDPPENYKEKKFDWNTYLKDPKVMAPVQMFPHLKINEGRADSFKVGMKLETDCPISLKLHGVTPATVIDVIGLRVLIHLDCYDSRYDFWTPIDSPRLHPINWHKTKGIKIHTNRRDFNWDTYLTGTKSKSVAEEAFHPREPLGFEVGMKLEVVDPKNPALVRPAYVQSVNGHRIAVCFDNWPESYAYWVEDDDPDLHPTHWAKHTNHPLEHIKLSKKKNKNDGCTVIKYCRNIGNALYKSRSGHKVMDECPYHMKNWKNCDLSDRLDSKRKLKSSELTKVITKQQKTTTLKKLPLPPKTNGNVKPETIDMDDAIDTTNIITQPLKPDDQTKLCSELLKINSTNLSYSDTPPIHWSPNQVSNYIKDIPACERHGAIFETQEIDGTALLSLSKEDLMHELSIKLGPAIKIYNCILKLREQVLLDMMD